MLLHACWDNQQLACLAGCLLLADLASQSMFFHHLVCRHAQFVAASTSCKQKAQGFCFFYF
jgi:hypothetical protein